MRVTCAYDRSLNVVDFSAVFCAQNVCAESHRIHAIQIGLKKHGVALRVSYLYGEILVIIYQNHLPPHNSARVVINLELREIYSAENRDFFRPITYIDTRTYISCDEMVHHLVHKIIKAITSMCL